MAYAFKEISPATNPLQAAAKQEAIRGRFNLIKTPNNAGSVTPKIAVKNDE